MLLATEDDPISTSIYKEKDLHAIFYHFQVKL